MVRVLQWVATGSLEGIGKEIEVEGEHCILGRALTALNLMLDTERWNVYG